ncbi:tetratricopeptide repeat protein [Lentibacillus saliphilus]|uniref:tetratricopeptide repeat protein n=1 Tax=Lentibacillus saliphilus TaxID=2737028 RepID=UPI001C30E0A6|nr:tetratricopeptide repeat protein [Lentibacillus saliphilus]
MTDQHSNVILFPKLQATLEQESLVALTDKNYSEALEKLNQLIEHDIKHHDIMMSKLICLMELDRIEEAEQLCEILMGKRDAHYYEYVHIYLTILFQSAQYDVLIEIVDEELGQKEKVPSPFKDQFKQLQQLSQHMREELIIEHAAKLMRDLHKAHQHQHHHQQWLIIEELQRIGAPPRQNIDHYLTDDSVHPMVKTSLFKWYRDRGVNQPVNVHKLGLSGEFTPMNVPRIENHVTIKETRARLNEMDQSNPTMFQQLHTLLLRFAYVRYPLIPDEDQAPALAEALISIGNNLLSIHNETDEHQMVSRYVEELNLCDGLYLSIIDA